MYFFFSVQGVIMPQKVLIVDDEPSIILPLQFLMEQNGYIVTIAHNGEEAIKEITEFKPDLILLDIMLPVLDGFEICQILKENPKWKNIKIILVTAMGRDVNIAKGLALGADAYITKPFANSDIVQKVNELLNISNET